MWSLGTKNGMTGSLKALFQIFPLFSRVFNQKEKRGRPGEKGRKEGLERHKSTLCTLSRLYNLYSYQIKELLFPVHPSLARKKECLPLFMKKDENFRFVHFLDSKGSYRMPPL